MTVVHGLRAVWDGTTLSVEGPRAGAPTVIHEVLGSYGELVGAVYGSVTDHEAQAVVENIAQGTDPDGPDVPWFAVAIHTRGGVVATASTLLSSGVFWAASRGRIVVATDPSAALDTVPAINPSYVRDFAAGRVEPGRTPYIGVERISAGNAVAWGRVDGRPSITQWCGPCRFANADLCGDAAVSEYLTAFDTVIGDLISRTRTPVLALSGGLDSTFVAAALARQTTAARPTQGLVWVPLPAAQPVGSGKVWDEFGFASMMADEFPGRIAVEALSNVEHQRPLAAAAAAASLAGVPSFNPANQWWLTAIRDRAKAAGEHLWFVGVHGNAAFSGEHDYAARYYLRRGRLRSFLSLGQAGDGSWSAAAFRSKALRHALHTGSTRSPHPLAVFGIEAVPSKGGDGRGQFLDWLARSDSGLPAFNNPAANEGVLVADPFAARPVMEVAAAIAPAEWQRGPVPRGFARRAGLGRVPEPIRMRLRRGQQGRDAWYVIRDDRDEYLDRIATIASVPGLEDVRFRDLARHVGSWPWGQSTSAPQWPEHVAVDRLLAVAEFALGCYGQPRQPSADGRAVIQP